MEASNTRFNSSNVQLDELLRGKFDVNGGILKLCTIKKTMPLAIPLAFNEFCAVVAFNTAVEFARVASLEFEADAGSLIL